MRRRRFQRPEATSPYPRTLYTVLEHHGVLGHASLFWNTMPQNINLVFQDTPCSRTVSGVPGHSALSQNTRGVFWDSSVLGCPRILPEQHCPRTPAQCPGSPTVLGQAVACWDGGAKFEMFR